MFTDNKDFYPTPQNLVDKIYVNFEMQGRFVNFVARSTTF